MDNQNADTVSGIFHEVFLCRLAYRDTMSVDYIKMMGLPTTLDEEKDNAFFNSEVERYLTINDIAEYFREGINVSVVRYEDTKKIYENITRHLEAWQYEINYLFGGDYAPLDDLILLDKLADKVYGHAKYVGKKHINESPFASLFRGFDTEYSTIDINALPIDVVSPDPSDNTILEPDVRRDEHGYKERITLADAFRAQLR